MVPLFRSLLFGLNLFYQTIYIPIALMVYFPLWYRFNCTLHPLCDFLGKRRASRLIDELTAFFRHATELGNGWSTKEILHLTEVRDLLDILFVLWIISITLMLIAAKGTRISRCAKFNLLALICLLIIVPFFEYFWTHIFHPLFFDNDYWKTNPSDKSFYIMPAGFFKNSLIFLLITSLTIHTGIWFFFRKSPNKR
jgi:uncharacterized membrane protein